jgi:hypothetical protein
MGTPSMKFFVSQIEIGSAVVAMKTIVATIESSSASWTNRP